MTKTSVPSFWRVVAGSWVLLSVLSIAWSMSTPLAAAPDEPAHLIKAASVVRGELVGAPGELGRIVRVPAYIGYTQSQTCMAGQANVTANCAGSYPGNPGDTVEASTTAGLYNPAYYVIVGWPSLLFADQSGIFAMRIVSAVASSLFLAFGIAMLCGWRRRTFPLIGAVTAITPMVLFLNGTVSPNSLEIAATFAVFVGMMEILRQSDDAHLPRNAAIVVTAAALAANARGLSPLWLAVAVFTPFLLVSRARIAQLLRRRSVHWVLAGVAFAVAGAAAWLLASNSLGAGMGDAAERVHTPGVGASPVAGFVWTLLATFHYALGIVGVFGWLDTPSPEFVYFAWAMLAGGIVVLAATVLTSKHRAFALSLLAAVIFLPPVVQAIYISGGGIVWQGRYTLPLFVCAMVGLSVVLGERISLSRHTQNRILVIVLTIVAVAQFQAFATALRRYATGLDSGWTALLHPAWSPPGGIALWLAVFAAALTVSAFSLVALGRSEPAPAGVDFAGQPLESGREKPHPAHEDAGTGT